MPHTYDYPRPALTVDLVVFAFDDTTDQGPDLQVMLIQRGLPPFKGKWALPGGFLQPNEDIADAARRELEEETGLKDIHLEQLATYGDPTRDPREHVVTVAHLALVSLHGHTVRATTDADNAAWFSVNDVPKSASSFCPNASPSAASSLSTKPCWAAKSTNATSAKKSSKWTCSSKPTRSKKTSPTGPPSSTSSTKRSTTA